MVGSAPVANMRRRKSVDRKENSRSNPQRYDHGHNVDWKSPLWALFLTSTGIQLHFRD